MKSFNKIVIALFYLIIQSIYSQSIPNRFDKISVSDGLSVGTVNVIMQDQSGFLWFGTEDGLNRYDGYNFVVYKNSQKDNGSLSNNYIWALEQDQTGNIWIGTDGGGLNKYNPITKTFSRFLHDPEDDKSIGSNVIQSLLIDSQNNLWIGSWGSGLLKYDFDNNTFIKIPLHDSEHPKNEVKFIWTIYEDARGNIWLGTDNEGLISLNPNTNELISYLVNDDKNSISGNSITSVCEDNYGNFWIGTYGSGLNRFDPIENKFFKYGINSSWNNSITDEMILKVYKDSKGRIWAVSMENGLFLYDRSKDTFINYKFNPYDNYSLSSDNVRSIYEDNTNTLWISTLGEGLNKINLRNNNFYFIKNEITNSQSIKENFVFSILEDSFGDMWFGTYGGGISKLVKKTGKFKFYNYDGDRKYSINSNFVRTIFEDSNKDIWIGNYPGGLNKYIRINDNFISYNVGNKDDELNNTMVRMIFEDSKKRLWIGTNGGGLSYFNRSTNTFTLYRNDDSDPASISGDAVLSISEDKEGDLWVGTYGNGLNKFNSSNKTFTRYINNPKDNSSLSNNIVTELFVCSDSVMWIGTWGGGLNFFDRKSNTFSSISTNNGLLSDVICGIIEDDQNNLWISTLRGISKLNKNDLSVKNFDQSDGLIPGEYNPSARTKTMKGWIYFGGSKGINYFHPDSIYSSQFKTSTIITSFKKHNIEVPLNESIEFTDTVYLSHSEDNFSFEFSSLDFSNPMKNQYSYKLENYDKDWILSDTRRYANYTHLDYGEYIFKVKATNSNGVWSSNYDQLTIIITPPFWSTWYFRILLFLIITLIVFYYYQRKIKMFEKERLAQESFTERLINSQENERKRIASGLHDSLGQNLLVVKNRAILGLNSDNINLAKKELEEISNTASLALDEVRHIAYNLHPYQLSRLGLSKAIQSIINNIGESSKIQFKSRIENIDNLLPKNMEINIFRIVQECINNIIKHAQAKNVEVNISVNDELILLEVIDDGIGFDSSEIQSEGLGMQNMSKRVNFLKGSIQIKSSLGNGTKIIVKISVK